MGNRSMEKAHIILDPIISRVYQKKRASSDKKLFLKELTYEILRQSGYKFSLTLPTPVERLRVLLGMDLSFSKKLFTDARSVKTKNAWNIELTANHIYFNGSQRWLTERGRFSLAHEIAHFVLEYIQDRFVEITEALRLKEENIEGLCDFLSSEFLLPSYLFECTSFKHFLKTAKEQSFSFNRESHFSAIGLLETLRKSLKVSRITLIRRLDRTRLLDEVECGIIISMFSVNRITGRSPALRVFRAATPTWGFIPRNIRLSTIGLDSATYAFNGLRYGKPQEWKGKVKVSEKDKTGTKSKWVSRTIESWGEHVLYPFVKRQKYLITTLKWENPKNEGG